MSFMKRNDDELDQAVAQVTGEPIDPAGVEQAAARVWQRLTQEGAVGIATGESTAAMASLAALAPDTAPPASLRGCEDFQALIPAYLKGELAPARALLVEDHTRSCVPCRRALREAREGRRVTTHPVAAATSASAASRRARPIWLALAAALVIGLGLGIVLMLQEIGAGGERMARIESVEGGLYRIDGEKSEPVGAGDALAEGEQVRTAKGSRALVRMEDGSLIEMNERAGISLAAGRAGNTIQLDRGRIIVQAAKQRPRHLYVATGDCRVSVTGTIFSVNHGTKGSRVSVIEGEVRVQQSGRDSLLHPGDQVTTHATVAAVPIRREIAWSRDAGRYQTLLAELTAAGKAIDAQVERPGLRTSTRLLDLAPEGTTVYIALPNLAESLGETQRLLDERIRDSEVLRQWWGETLGSSENEARFHEMIEEIRDLGRNLGDEVVVAFDAGHGGQGGQEGHGEPVLLAEVTNEAAFRAALEAEVAKVNARTGKTVLAIVADPATVPAGNEGMLLWVGDGIFAASPSGARLAQVAANAGGASNPFTGSSFHRRIAEAYQDGAGWLFSADLARLVRDREGESERNERAEALGILDLENFIVDRREIGGAVETRAVLTFDQPRRGIASWLAEPAPMGALSFISPDANLVAAFVVKNPVSLVDDLLATSPELAAELAEVKAKHGFDLREDVASPLGGEIALAIDGPVLPKPSWKLVAEVYDPERLQHTLATAVARLDAELRQDGKPGIRLAEETAGGRTWYSVVSTDPAVEVHYLYEDGYLVAAPSRALLERTLQQRASGVTIASSPRFRDLLGEDGQVNVSAVVYQNLAPLAEAGASLLPKGAREGMAHGPSSMAQLLVGGGPTLIYAYAGEDRIQFGSRGEAGPLGQSLSTLAGFGGILGRMGEAGGHMMPETPEDTQ